MADKILAKDQLGAFVERVKAGREVFAPALQGDKLTWAPVESAEGLLFDFSNTEMSPKDFFFPQTECMMRFANDAGQPQGMVMQAEPELSTPRALMNIRPCDAKAFQVLDLIFVQDQMTNDAYWRDKREKTLLIGLACNDPCPTCFCASVGSNPHGQTGLDLLLVDLGQALLVKVLSDQGAELTADLPEATAAHQAQAAQLKAQAEAALGAGEVVAMDQVNAREVMELYEAPLWDRVQEACLNCGTCTFCCPTCHCFDIQDEVQGAEGRRVRNWDYCMSWLFTMHGTGHNPRGNKKDRVRQRFMHKFKYIPMKRDGEIGCVGCGRCVRLCPVNIDVRRVVNQMNG